MASRAREAERGITVPATAGQAQEYEAAHGVLQRTPTAAGRTRSAHKKKGRPADLRNSPSSVASRKACPPPQSRRALPLARPALTPALSPGGPLTSDRWK